MDPARDPVLQQALANYNFLCNMLDANEPLQKWNYISWVALSQARERAIKEGKCIFLEIIVDGPPGHENDVC